MEPDVKMETGSAEGESAAIFGAIDMLLLVVTVGVAGWLLMKKLRPQQTPSINYDVQVVQSMYESSSSSETSFVQKLRASGRSLVVFYGSQTGTAEEFASRLAKEGVRFRLKGMLADPEECAMEELAMMKELPNSLALFCLATYGEGDPTDNAQEFFEWLQNGDTELAGLNYAVFGLGNKTYEHYNEMAKYVDKRLEELGATRVFEMGLGDDDANIEDDFITWKDRLWPAVCEFFGIEASGEEESIRQFRLTEHTEVALDRAYTGEVARLHSLSMQRPPFDSKNPFMAPVLERKELYSGSDRSCMHIELGITDSKIRYDAGDHVAVYPENDKALVERIGELLEVNLDIVFTLTNVDEDSSKKHPFPCPCSYRTALSFYVDITCNPRTHVLKEIAEYTSDPDEKAKLKLMASTSVEGKQEYQDWIIKENRSIVHVLEDLQSCKPKLDHLLELMPRLQARYYSISSSPKAHSDRIHVTAALVRYETPTGRTVNGVATSWLAKKALGEKIPVFVRRSAFRLPTRPQTPVVMVGPGTGIAPFRGFLQERAIALEQGKPVGETILYFGCRKRDQDFLYQAELEEFVSKGVLKLHAAFSRDQAEKVYVTHLMKQHKEELWRILGKENGHLYVCGDARNMARDVHNLVVELVAEGGDMNHDAANSYVKKMEAQKRYSADVWS
ncbi:NADPH--cytochrome P450 reductase [Neocloeon triangulifer]|uniref:NADPH--cytochrome P450 reductase n=1 Tax=Neocloeon triangulifer TaxID=2078957 RepID=UPI00286F1D38|nr:NADPH--cytochrome P450 reductase [Neocloeon triangulifer]